MPPDMDTKLLLAGVATALVGSICVYSLVSPANRSGGGDEQPPGLLKSFFLFFYSCFIKPHTGDSKGNQQDALESFYKKQAGAYDATRGVLLQGREDMLALVAAQLKARAEAALAEGHKKQKRRIWVDV